MIQWTCHIKALSSTERSLTMSKKRKDNKGRILRTGESQRKEFKKLHPDKPLPHITPHVFLHTFCTNMANAGMDIKIKEKCQKARYIRV